MGKVKKEEAAEPSRSTNVSYLLSGLSSEVCSLCVAKCAAAGIPLLAAAALFLRTANFFNAFRGACLFRPLTTRGGHRFQSF